MSEDPKLDNDDEHLLGDPALDHTDVLPPTPMVGGKYKLGRLLGEGGMGSVYEAEHTGLGVKVAVKLLNEVFASDPSSITRFRREARAAAAIRHPNIVEVTDTGTDEGGVPFIVMELLEGESLSALLRRERMLPPSVASIITYQILSGLGAAHEKGVIHRDLKPGNILLARNDLGSYQVKILDFGISKFFDGTPSIDVTATGAVIGTPRFMAPEQAKGQSDLDARVDLYAVGVLFYRMITGKLPFGARNQEDILRAILEGNIKPPRQIRKDISPELERIILTAMATDRESRYSTAAAFMTDLQQAVPDVVGGGTVQITAHTGLTAGPTPLSLNDGTFPSAGSRGSRELSLDKSTRPASPFALRVPKPKRPYLLIALLSLLGLGGVLAWFIFQDQGSPTKLHQATYSGPDLTFGITRYLPETQLNQEHNALIRYLSQRLQRKVRLKIFEDYVDISAELSKGKLDLAALSAYLYVRAKRKMPNLKLISTHVTTGGTSYEGYVIAKANTGVTTLKDLENKVFCYVSPNSSSGFLYPRALFRRQHMDPDKAFKATRFTGDHLSALKALEGNACDGAAVFAGIFFEAQKHGLPPQKYTILAATARIPYDAYCVSPTMPKTLTRAIRDAMLALKPGSDLAESVLGKNSRITGFAPAMDSDYESVRKIEKYIDTADTDKKPSK